MALRHEVQAELVDQRRFAGAGHAADADPDGFAGRGEELIEQRFGARLVLGLGAFDQGDGAGERHTVAVADGLGRPLNVLLRSVVAAHGMRG